ncbi:uncharacterized protein FTOL_00841 [Fusarium torulosum]|uniref:Uncharacterized protein n=1 Tax=Fusarium torulosum TaxID=33205 RepID=A0AAE8SCV8_9HYPO|nr:uncharacterized protein FTOL_00841 [Fusarium torulosum]
MACEGVLKIYFQVRAPNIETLKVLRCGQQAGVHGDLIINGASEFDDTYLDEWESRPHPDAKVYLGQGVRIRVDLEHSRFWSESKSNISRSEQQDVRDALNKMQKTNKEGNWWDQWKGSVASILGILVMGHKSMAGASASASGFCFSIKYGSLAFNFAKGSAAASAVATAAGTAIALGAVTGLAVYIIPWDKFLPWLGNTMSSWGTWFKSMWDKFWGWWNGSSERTGCNPGHLRADFM